MSDRALQELLRTAHAQGDPASWLAATRGLSRAGEFSQAASALDLAASRGTDVGEAREALELTDLDGFERRELVCSQRLAGKLRHAAWSEDGRTLFAIEDFRRVVSWDVDSGASRLGVEVPDGVGHDRVGALAAGPGGRLALALGTLDLGWSDESALCVIESLEGSLERAPRIECERFCAQLRFHGELLVARQTTRVVAFDVGSGRKVWTFNSPLIALGRGVVAIKRGKLLFLEPLAEVPLASFKVELAVKKPWALAAARERALVLTGEETLSLFGPQGELARASCGPLDLRFQRPRFLPSPSGRYVCVDTRDDSLRVVDLRTGAIREFALEGRVQSPSWSPSGRVLAVPTLGGTVVLLGAPPIPRGGEVEVDWTELRTSERFWRVRVSGAVLEYRHGQIGQGGRFGRTECASPEAAAKLLARRVREKRRAGYRPRA